MKQRKMAILHYQVGEMDGVSLEIEKWKLTFEGMGHQVTLVAGHLGTSEGVLIEELYHHTPVGERLRHNMLWGLDDYENDEAYRADLEAASAVIEEKFSKFIEENHIDFLVAENIWSVMANPAVALALGRIIERYELQCIAHSHDFFWEKIGDYSLTCPTAIELVQKYVPPRNPLVHHAVINQQSKKQLWERKGIDSVVVPNIFDFDEKWVVDEYNGDFPETVGIRPGDIVFLQATRIVQRKAIELAVDFVKALNSPERRAQLMEKGLYDGRKFSADNRIVLVLAGYSRDGDTQEYIENLKRKIARENVEALFIEEWIGGDRDFKNGHKVYSLWDTYVYADFVTYPSIWEGWGNQLLEALKAKLPIMLFEYPVYEEDIKPNGFEVISLGNEISGFDDLGLVKVDPGIIDSAADEAIELLTDPTKRESVVEKNYAIAKKQYSMDALRRYLTALMETFEGSEDS